MNLLKHTILYSILAVFLSSCGEDLLEYDNVVEMPVVEAYLMEGASSFSVKLYSVESLTEINTSKPIKGLQVYANDQLLTESQDGGTYTLSLPGNALRENQKFELSFTRNGQRISGNTIIPAKPAVKISQSYIYRKYYYFYYSTSSEDEVYLTWDDPDHSYYQVYVQHLDDSSSSGSGFPGMDFPNRMMQPFQGNSYTLREMDIRSSGNYRIILYRVDKDYAELYERISSTDLANPVSSIENALGVFTSMASDTVYFSVLETE